MMNSRRMVSLLTLALVLSSALKASQADEWVKFSPEGGGFSLLMPSQPQPVPVKQGEDFVAHMFSATTGADVYVVIYGDYAPSVRLNPDGELKANRDNFLRDLNAALTSSKSIELDGRSGIEFTGENTGHYFKSRVYLFGNRVYQIAAAFPEGDVDSAKIDHFLTSFAFTSPGGHSKP